MQNMCITSVFLNRNIIDKVVESDKNLLFMFIIDCILTG